MVVQSTQGILYLTLVEPTASSKNLAHHSGGAIVIDNILYLPSLETAPLREQTTSLATQQVVMVVQSSYTIV